MSSTALEEVRAVLLTRFLLVDLCDPKRTPRVPKALRERAAWLLEHYPATADSACTVRLMGEVLDVLFADAAS